jgi:glycosyltransferase involved in cell wall biosynthesis
MTQPAAGGFPLISVIMPCYNAERFVAEAVDSVLNQTYPNVELIVVEDGSTDDSLEVLRRYDKRIRLLTQKNTGPDAARNLGLAHAQGQFVAFLDADDWWSQDSLQKLYTALAAHPECAVAYCGWQKVGNLERGTHPFVPRDYEQPNKVELLLTGGAPWPIHAALTRKAHIDRAGGFSQDLIASEDYDLWLRLVATHRVALVPEVLAYYRFHDGGQISSRPYLQALSGWDIKRRFLREHPDLAAALGAQKIKEVVDFELLRRGYQFHWKRDLSSSQAIFRKCLWVGAWKMSDLGYLMAALLPLSWYRVVVDMLDRNPPEKAKW